MNGHKEGADDLASRIHLSVQDQIILYQDIKIQFTVSIGAISFKPSEHKKLSIDKIITAVDDCLYEAKNTGRNKIISKIYHKEETVSSING